jgi:predicted enzyme related to lactoylglutathione lyase
MIQKMSHATIYCTDQDAALEFYKKVGLEVRTDAKMENGYRWLTVGPKGQPDLEIVLMEVKPSQMMDEKTAAELRALIARGTFGVGVFVTADCKQTAAEIEKAGGQLMRPPTQQFYGLEALVRDPSGNWFSLCERNTPH